MAKPFQPGKYSQGCPSIPSHSIQQFRCGYLHHQLQEWHIAYNTEDFTEHRSPDLLTKKSPVVYDRTAYSHRFSTYIYEIMSGDIDRAKFLQNILGYDLTGDTRHECMTILYGVAASNGVVLIAADAEKPIEWVIGHETGHVVTENNPEGWQSLQSYAVAKLGRDAVQKKLTLDAARRWRSRR